jgi:hypothetical protein
MIVTSLQYVLLRKVQFVVHGALLVAKILHDGDLGQEWHQLRSSLHVDSCLYVA